MACTILQILSQSALEPEVLAGPLTDTTNTQWTAVENIRTWQEFNFEILTRRFNNELNTHMKSFAYTETFRMRKLIL